jgi:hypothetical protein
MSWKLKQKRMLCFGLSEISVTTLLTEDSCLVTESSGEPTAAEEISAHRIILIRIKETTHVDSTVGHERMHAC